MRSSIVAKSWPAFSVVVGAVLILVGSFLRLGNGPLPLLVLLGLAVLFWLGAGPYAVWLEPKLAGRRILWKISFPSSAWAIGWWKRSVVICAVLALILLVFSALSYFAPGGAGPSFALAYIALVLSSLWLGLNYTLKRVQRIS
jgi:hypothetical protein